MEWAQAPCHAVKLGKLSFLKKEEFPPELELLVKQTPETGVRKTSPGTETGTSDVATEVPAHSLVRYVRDVRLAQLLWKEHTFQLVNLT